MNATASASSIASLPLVADWPAGYRSSPECIAFELLTRRQHGKSRVIPIVAPSATMASLFADGALDLMRDAFESSRELRRALVLDTESATSPVVALRLMGERFSMLPPVLRSRAAVEAGVSLATRALPSGHPARRAALAVAGIMAGSAWSRDLLLASGANAVSVVPTGVHLDLFKPVARSGKSTGHFVIYSAGRLGHRKGHDIVLRAVRAFRERHPETLLLTAWQSPLPESAADLVRAGLIDTTPPLEAGMFVFHRWAVQYGFPEGTLVDAGEVSQSAVANLLSEVDVALFPNRAEYDQNSRLVECLAAGVPVIASDNTGHRDIIDSRDMWPLTEQRALLGAPIEGADGWGESSIDEIVAHLEWIYAHRDEARTKAAGARARLANNAWGSVVQAIDATARGFAR